MAKPDDHDETAHDCSQSSKNSDAGGYVFMTFGETYGPYNFGTVCKMNDGGLSPTTIMTVIVDGIERGEGHACDLFAEASFCRVICEECDLARTYQLSGPVDVPRARKDPINFAYMGKYDASPNPLNACLRSVFWKCPLRDSDSGCRARVEEGA